MASLSSHISKLATKPHLRVVGDSSLEGRLVHDDLTLAESELPEPAKRKGQPGFLGVVRYPAEMGHEPVKDLRRAERLVARRRTSVGALNPSATDMCS